MGVNARTSGVRMSGTEIAPTQEKSETGKPKNPTETKIDRVMQETYYQQGGVEPTKSDSIFGHVFKFLSSTFIGKGIAKICRAVSNLFSFKEKQTIDPGRTYLYDPEVDTERVVPTSHREPLQGEIESTDLPGSLGGELREEIKEIKDAKEDIVEWLDFLKNPENYLLSTDVEKTVPTREEWPTEEELLNIQKKLDDESSEMQKDGIKEVDELRTKAILWPKSASSG